MKNVWKGLVVGALVGALIGIVLDSLNGGSRQLKQAGRQVKERAPAAAEWLSANAERGASLLADAGIPDLVRDTAHKVTESGHKVAESGAADHAREAVGQAASQAKDVAGQAKDVAADALAKGKDVAGEAVAKGKAAAAEASR